MDLFSLNDQKLAALFRAVKMGMPKKNAAMLAGLTGTVFDGHLKAGWALVKELEDGTKTFEELKELDQLRVKMVLGMARAQSEGLDLWLEAINTAIPQDWRAGAWLAERRFSRDFGKRVYEETTTTGVVHNATTIEDVLLAKKQMRDWEEEQFGGDVSG